MLAQCQSPPAERETDCTPAAPMKLQLERKKPRFCLFVFSRAISQVLAHVMCTRSSSLAGLLCGRVVGMSNQHAANAFSFFKGGADKSLYLN